MPSLPLFPTKPPIPSPASTMADSYSCHLRVPNLPSTAQPIPSKSSTSSSCTHIICKCLVIILVLAILPLFPSRAPDFITQSIFTKFWELLHLLFIGITVSYGLFSRRRTTKGNVHNLENHSRFDSSSQACFSGILHVSSVFGDGFNGLCGSDEKKWAKIWNAQYLHSVSERSGLDESNEFGSSIYEGELGNSYWSGEENATRVWNSQFFQGKSMVVVANENCFLDQLGNPISRNHYKPLGLPVRSLRSTIVESGGNTPKCGSENSSSSSFKGSSKTEDNGKVKNEEIRGVTPINLDKKFKETVSASPIPWRSRSVRMEMGEKLKSAEHPCSHTRPLSVGAFDFEGLKSDSLMCQTTSSKSKKPSNSSSPPKEPSHSLSIPSEIPKDSSSKMGSFERKKGLYSYSDSIAESLTKSRNGEPTISAVKTRFSFGSTSEMNEVSSVEDGLKGLQNGRKEDQLARGKQGVDTMELKAAPAKSLSRGKSVRTIRSSEQMMEPKKTEEKCGKLAENIDGNVGAKRGNFEVMNNSGMNVGLENLSSNIRKWSFDNLCDVPNSAISECQDPKKEDFGGSDLAESQKESKGNAESFHVSSDEEEARSDMLRDGESEANEVDRKAGEFIAKFREQIRLQKVASFRRYSNW